METKKLYIASILTFVSGQMAQATQWEEMDTIGDHRKSPYTYVDNNRGASDITDQLFVGTSTNANDPAGTVNDVYSIDTSNDTPTSILSANGVWGATADPKNSRILFTQSSGLTPPPGLLGGGDHLYELPYAGGAPVLLGRITFAGEALRIDGLAMRNDILYGYNAGGGATNGLFTIDLNTFAATQISTTPDSISGLDADPETCIIYGVNDTTGQVVTLDTSGNITNLAAYPGGVTDIDGIAVGGGFAYLVTDEAGDLNVLNLSTLQYGTPLTSPFTAADTFSAGALAFPDPALNMDHIFKNGFEFDFCADIQ